jgi:sec-independent protein translocase protein TatB
MFDIGWSEMAVILLVALIVIGPKDLPRVARTMGRWVAKGRAMAREFQTALEDMAREAELDKVKSEIEKAGRTDVGKTIERTIDPTGELSKAFDPSTIAKPATPPKASESAAKEAPATATAPEATAGADGKAAPAGPKSTTKSASAKASPAKRRAAKAPAAAADSPSSSGPASSPATPAEGPRSAAPRRSRAAATAEQSEPAREPTPVEPT